ncbi:MAG: hypothetical protein HeimC2_20970 [Candidatus Heimdallarchaeota archaeon LC_2]|nr:MAG: hypothetical protein HeimC2_20970 [Candidatus Heimdallarchaeota archaeon LC_2]
MRTMNIFEHRYVYIFQASTSIIVDLDDFTNEVVMLWGVNNDAPSRHLKIGDGVLIKSVKHQGIVGYGEITRGWHQLDKPMDLGRRSLSKFGVKILYKGRFQSTLTTSEMRKDRILSQMEIMKRPQGTFFILGSEEKRRLKELLKDK